MKKFSALEAGLNALVLELVDERDDIYDFFISEKYEIKVADHEFYDLDDLLFLFREKCVYEKLDFKKIFASIYKECLYKSYRFNFVSSVDDEVHHVAHCIICKKDAVKQILSEYNIVL